MNQSIPLIFNLSTTPLEAISFLLSIITVALNIRQIHWGWLFAIISSALYSIVFFNAKLYGDMCLQFIFIAVACWGWMQWVKPGLGLTQIKVTQLSNGNRLLAFALTAITSIPLFWILKIFTDTDVPGADAILTAGSLLGQVLLSRKKLENWYVWIAVDVLYVGLYIYKNLMLTAVLYALFVVMAVMGVRAWKQSCLT